MKSPLILFDSLALKIHISKDCADLLVENGDLFEIEYRGFTAIKVCSTMCLVISIFFSIEFLIC